MNLRTLSGCLGCAWNAALGILLGEPCFDGGSAGYGKAVGFVKHVCLELSSPVIDSLEMLL